MDPKSRTLPTPGFLVALLEMYPENFTIFLHTESLPNGEKKAFTIVSNTDLKEEGVTPGADTRHGKFVISSCSLSARDKFPFEALPIEPVGAFLVPRGDDSVDLEAQPAGDDWVKVSKPEGGEGGLARGIVFAERKREGLGSEGLVALLVFSYTFLAFGLLFLSYTLRDSMYRRCR